MKINVYVTFDTQNQTWNIMNMDNECVFYGVVNDEVDEIKGWLDEHKDTHQELP